MSLEKVRAALAGTELEQKIIVPEESSATVELAAQALHTEPDRIAKTLSFLVDDQPILIVVSGLSRIDNAKFKAKFHKKAKMIPSELVEELTGHAPGGVCPFAVKEGVKIYLDNSLKKYEIVYPAAGGSSSAVEITIPQLERFVNFVEWVDVVKAFAGEPQA